MKALFLVLILSLSGCATYSQMDDWEKQAVWIGAAVVIGALVIADGQDTVVVQGSGCHTHGQPPHRWDCPEL